MATISLTLPVSGTVITAGLHSTNYTIVQNAINGGLDNNNWATGRIFAPSKLMQEGATDKQILQWVNGTTTWTPVSLKIADLDKVVAWVYDRTVADTDVANTVTETSIYTKSIAANDMLTSRTARLTIDGDYLHNNVAADTIILRVKFGGTTVYQSNAYNLGNALGAGRHPFTLGVRVQNRGATNAQLVTVELRSEIANTGAPTTGVGLLGPATPILLTGQNTATIDTTANQTLDITAQWSAANANNSWRSRGAILEMM